jgi:DNA-binding CsgD family transcriptional regulator
MVREEAAVIEEQFLDTLTLIHEAAFSPAAWTGVLRRLADLTGCIAGGLTIEDPQSGRGTPISYFGFDPNHVERTFDHFLPLNPLFAIADRMVPGFIVTNGDVVALKDFQHSDFYNGWARPQGLCSPITLVTHRSASHYLPLTLVKPDGAGEASSEDRSVLARFTPHLLQAVKVTLQLQAAEMSQNQFRTVLAGVSSGAILIDDHLRVLFISPAAELFLDQGARQPLSIIKGALTACDPASDQRLQKALQGAVAANTPARGAGVAIQRSNGPGTITVDVSPLPRASAWHAASDTYDAGRAACLVLIDDAGVSAMARRYCLTPAETRVVEAIVIGKGLSWAARQLGVSRSTAQSHMDKIFQKTATNRQAELVAMTRAGRHPF